MEKHEKHMRQRYGWDKTEWQNYRNHLDRLTYDKDLTKNHKRYLINQYNWSDKDWKDYKNHMVNKHTNKHTNQYTKILNVKNTELIIEYRFEHNGTKIADLISLTNGQINFIFEINNTHKTLENNRPEPWYEFKAQDIFEYTKTKKLFCIRQTDHGCLNCKTAINCKRCGKKVLPEIEQTNVKRGICKNCDIQIYDKIYLNVPYNQKEGAKKLGAHWDPLIKKWYCCGNNIEKFQKWTVFPFN